MIEQTPQANEGRTDTDAAIEAGVAQTVPHRLDTADGTSVFVVHTAPGGSVQVIDPEKSTEWRAGRPRRKTGRYTAHSPASLVAYVQRHLTDDTEVWADTVERRIVAVIDGHGIAAPGHHEHTMTLGVDRSASWKRWKAADQRLMTQAQFADFIEQAADEVVDPSAAVLLDIAQTVTGHRNVQFESAERLDNGDMSVVWKEDTTAKAGKDGKLTIPSHLTLRIRPFVGAAPAEVKASLRHRVTKEGVTLGYALLNPDGIEEAVFDAYVSRIAGDLGATIPVFYGKTSA